MSKGTKNTFEGMGVLCTTLSSTFLIGYGINLIVPLWVGIIIGFMIFPVILLLQGVPIAASIDEKSEPSIARKTGLVLAVLTFLISGIAMLVFNVTDAYTIGINITAFSGILGYLLSA